MTLREHLEQRLDSVAHRMDQVDARLAAAAIAQGDYLRRDAYEVAHETLRLTLDTLRATMATDVAELRMAVGATRSRLAGASAAIIVAVTVVSALMTALTVWGR